MYQSQGESERDAEIGDFCEAKMDNEEQHFGEEVSGHNQ
jgi:hypothetical protein